MRILRYENAKFDISYSSILCKLKKIFIYRKKNENIIDFKLDRHGDNKVNMV